MTRKTIRDYVDKYSDALVRTLKAKFSEQTSRMDALEAKLAALEARSPSVEYAGIFDAAKSYGRGVLVTKNGGLWLSLRETNQPPGADPHSWRLVVKEGRAQ